MSDFETILCERDGPALVITLNRPDRLNAFNTTMRTELIAAFDRADADDAVRAVIVTGAGRGFCAGSDMAEGTARLDPASREGVTGPDGTIDWNSPALRDSGGLLTLRIFASLKPVIAAVNGAAVGVGATMLLPMDIRLASDQARFGFAFARRGLVPEACSSWFLPRVVGISRAMEWTVTGRVFDAPEALAAGLIRSLHPPGDLLAAAHAIAAEIAAHTAPVSVALSRQMLWRMLGADHPMEAHRVDSRFVARQAHGGDLTEGVAAFLEKRPPAFPTRVSTGLPPWLPAWTEPTYE
jgi:enoyl-CoA hydratase/carnithine racemase